jgi:hypothetical protein
MHGISTAYWFAMSYFYLKQFKNIYHPNILVFAKLRNQARNLTSDECRVALRKVVLMLLKTGIQVYTVL